jgi:hypothetical protein
MSKTQVYQIKNEPNSNLKVYSLHLSQSTLTGKAGLLFVESDW